MWYVPGRFTVLPLPLCHIPLTNNTPSLVFAKAACAQASKGTCWPPCRPMASDILLEFVIGQDNMAMIYMSPDPYFDLFEQQLDLRKFDLATHATAGLSLDEMDGHVNLALMSPSTPAAKIPDWQTHVQGAWLIKIRDAVISTIDNAKSAITNMINSGSTGMVLLFAHPEI
jgi:hypothetical protein